MNSPTNFFVGQREYTPNKGKMGNEMGEEGCTNEGGREPHDLLLTMPPSIVMVATAATRGRRES